VAGRRAYLGGRLFPQIMNAASPAISLRPVSMQDSILHGATGFEHRHRRGSRGNAMKTSTRLKRAGVVAVVAAAHLAGLLALGRMAPQRPAAPEVTPIQVALLQAAAPAPPAPQPPALQPPAPELRQPVPPKAPPRPQTPPRPKPQTATKPAPVAPAPAQASPAPTAITAEAPTPQPAAPAAPASAPPAPVPTAPAPVTAARFDAAYLNNPKPPYPPLAQRLREEGKVMLKVLVSAAGLPLRVELDRSSGSERLDRAARDAVDGWKFVPARQGDQPIESWVLVPVIFKLQES